MPIFLVESIVAALTWAERRPFTDVLAPKGAYIIRLAQEKGTKSVIQKLIIQ